MIMKRFCAAIAIVSALLACPGTAQAQKFIPAEVTISRQTQIRDGRTYYVHQVMDRQTLYSICKAYGADLDEVRAINYDSLSQGLKSGTTLLIPFSQKESQTAAAQEPDNNAKPLPQGNNTQQSDNLPTETSPAASASAGEVRYILHRVKWYDSLLMLSLKYKVSQEDIIALNNLESRTLVVGQTLRIPVGETVLDDMDDNTIIDVPEEEAAAPGYDPERKDITIVEPEEPAEAEPGFVPFSGTANVALMIPIAASSNSPSGNFLDFYSGVLMGLNELKTSGINVNLKVIDMADYESPEQLLDASGLGKYDFVIGNFSPQSIEPVADYCDLHRIPLISPLDPKIEEVTYYHPYLVNVQISPGTQTMRLAESIHFKPQKDNVVVLCEATDTPGSFHKEVLASLDSARISYSLVKGRSSSLKDHMVSDKTNHVIITSEKESFVSDAVRNAGFLARSGYDIASYASHKIRRFESVDQDALQKMNAHFSMGYFVDYSDESVKEFVRSYRALYNAEPGNFAFQGHDIACYFIKALQKYGSDMINGIAGYKQQLLQLNFSFDRRGHNSGMFNEATRNVVYDAGGVNLHK